MEEECASCEESDNDDYEEGSVSEDGGDCDENWSPLEEMLEHGDENEDVTVNNIRYEKY